VCTQAVTVPHVPSHTGESSQTFFGMLGWVKRHRRPPIIIQENVCGAPWGHMIEQYAKEGYTAHSFCVDTKGLVDGGAHIILVETIFDSCAHISIILSTAPRVCEGLGRLRGGGGVGGGGRIALLLCASPPPAERTAAHMRR
jgi:hypothetical protein